MRRPDNHNKKIHLYQSYLALPYFLHHQLLHIQHTQQQQSHPELLLPPMQSQWRDPAHLLLPQWYQFPLYLRQPLLLLLLQR